MIEIQQNIPLAPYTTFKIGGPARFFCEVSSEEELVEALEYAKENNLDFFTLGGGSNILVSDDGFGGLVIKLIRDSNNLIRLLAPSLIECWAGEGLAGAVGFCAESSLTGMEWAAGIPGTVGGAIRGNAGAFSGCMADNTEGIKAIEVDKKLKIKVFKKTDCGFSYRNSIFKKCPNIIILSCVLKLKKGDKIRIENRIGEIIKKRAEKQPQGVGSAGSFFQNPAVPQKIIEEFEKETGVKCKDNKVPVGWLIDQVGLRGKKIGGVQVSPEHANFIVNVGNGKAQDVVILASLIKQKVRKQFVVQLKEEINYVGF